MVGVESVKAAIAATCEGKEKIIQLNYKALERGIAIGKGEAQ
jgi:Pyruvate/2-oxoacid:ferredoxin oxidoreductase gamma subunit